VFTFLM